MGTTPPSTDAAPAGSSTVTPLRGADLVDAIRSEIIAGRLEPGQRITEPAMATKFGVSRVPVREALRVLVSEGFVVLRPYGSATVAEVDQSIAQDLMEIRGVLEPLAARRAARYRDDADVEALESVLRAAGAALEDGDIVALGRLNTRFHRSVADASGNSLVAQTVGQLSSKLEWVYSSGMSHRADESWSEHAEIVRAIVAGEEATAERLMRTHIHSAAAEAVKEAAGLHDTGTDEPD